MRIITDPLTERVSAQREVIELLFNCDEYSRLMDYEGKQDSPSTIIFRAQIHEAFRWIIFKGAVKKDKRGFSIPPNEVKSERSKILKGLLLCSDLWAKRVFQGMSPEIKKVTDDDRMRAIRSFRISREAGEAMIDMGVAVGRASTLYQKILPTHLPDFESNFQASTGMPYNDFFACQCLIYSFLNSKETLGKGAIDLSEVKDHPIINPMMVKYLKSQAIDIGQISSQWNHENVLNESLPFDLRPFRDQPLICNNEKNEVIISDPVIFSESITAGPIFSAAKYTGLDRSFVAFGKAFEDYILGIFNNIFPDSIFPNRFNKRIPSGRSYSPCLEIDASLDYGTDIIVFEVKSAFIQEDAINDPDYTHYLDILREKYVQSKTGKPKGVGQLARLIENFEKAYSNSFDILNIKRIWPVLITHDKSTDTSLHGWFLSKEFRKILDVQDRNGYDDFQNGRFLIKDLIILTVDDLETLEKSLDSYSLLDLLNGYSESHRDRIKSLHNYIIESKYFKLLKRNKRLDQIAKDALDNALKRFGEYPADL